ncbi:MAG TPA: DUF4383 domain-containing protein [Allosphingosinicella sp.]|nr:DUF4383 domain-containing protein [Allosphingosinicella sp.]
MSTRTFALIFGIVFLIVGAGGFIPGILQPGTPDPGLTMTHGYGHELGLFPVNTLHNIVHILFGVWGLMAYRSLGGARTYARGVAIIYAVFTVMGLIPGLNTSFGMVPLYGNDVWLHALLAAVAAYFGWMNRDRVDTADRS